MDPRNQTRRLPRDHSARGRVRLFTRNGHDWSDRFPLITEAALRNRNSSFVLDGEAVLLGIDGRSDFNGLHSRRHDAEVQFYAFDILANDGEDLRRLPLSMRKANPARLRIMSSDFLNSHGLRPRLKRGTAPSSYGAAGGNALNAIGHFIVVYRPTAHT